MNRLRRIAITVCAMLAVLVLAAGYRYLASRGVFHSVEDKSPGLCRAIGGPVSDIVSDGKTAYVARDNALFAVTDSATKKLAGTPKAFRVRAMALAPAVNGDVFLRAILDQGEGRFSVALFRVKPDSVEEVGRITTDMLTDPAAIATPDGERFYLVNRHETHTSLGRWLDDTLLLPRAHLMWFDGMKFVNVAEHLNTPSGLALSADGSHLYIAQDYPRTLVGMMRSDFTGAIESPQALSMPSGPEHITVAADGSLIVAARPKSGAGEVFRVSLENGMPKTAELLFARKAEEVRAAAQVNNTLLVGTDKALLSCAMP